MKKSTFTSRQKILRQGIAAAAVAVCAGASMPAAAGLLIQLPVPPAPAVDDAFSQSRVVELDRARRALDLNSRLTANINQEGTPPLELPPIRGMGVDVTLADALRQIIPGGWKVFTEGEVPDDTIVSWQGNRTWPMALNTVLIPSSLKAVVDWRRNEVTLSSMKPAVKPTPKTVAALTAPSSVAATPVAPAQQQAFPSPAPAVMAAAAPAVAPAAPASPPVINVINQMDESRIAAMVAEKLKKDATAAQPIAQAPAAVPAAPVAAKPAPSAAPAPAAVLASTGATQAVPAPTVEQTQNNVATLKPAVNKTQWRLSRDKFLRENLRDWAASEGWELQWDAVIGDRVINYPVNADAVLEGDLIGAGGVIDRVIGKFERADEPLGVRFYRGNKVVVVFLYSANTSTFIKQTNQTAE